MLLCWRIVLFDIRTRLLPYFWSVVYVKGNRVCLLLHHDSDLLFHTHTSCKRPCERLLCTSVCPYSCFDHSLLYCSAWVLCSRLCRFISLVTWMKVSSAGSPRAVASWLLLHFKLELAAVTSPRVSSHICSASVITSYFCMPFCIVFIHFFLRSLLFFADSLSFTHVISIQVYNQSCMFSEKACPAASTPTFFSFFL